MKKLKKITIFTILVALIASSFWFFKNSPEGVEAGWWDYDWNYRKALTINHNQVAGDLTDFPVLVSFTDANLINHAQEDGDDFIFVDTNNNKLSHEIESYASSTGELVAWVKMPNLSSTQDVNIYLYYGNASVGSQEDIDDTWSNDFGGVWHMNDIVSSSTLESTTDLIKGQAKGMPLTTAGKISGALDYTGEISAGGATSTDWGTNGVVTVTNDSGSDRINSIVSDKDKNIYVAGYYYNSVTADFDWMIRKYDVNGDLDTSWGTNGVITVTNDSGGDDIRSIVIDNDRNIYVGGDYYNSGIGTNWMIRKYDASGNLDTSWGVDGVITVTNHGDMFAISDYVNSIVIDKDNNIYVTGSFYINFMIKTDLMIRKYDASGNLDTSWGSDGSIIIGTSGSDYPRSTVIDDDKNIYVAGTSLGFFTYDDWMIYKYDASGNLDTSWGSSGSIVINNSGYDYLTSIEVDNDKNIYVTGKVETDSDWTIRKYDENGNLDTSWGTNGVVTFINNDGSERINSIVSDKDKNIYVAGYYYNNVTDDNDWMIRKYDVNGDLDTSWGTNGGITTTNDDGSDSPSSIVIDNDRDIYVGGSYYNGVTADNDWMIRKYNGEVGDVMRANHRALSTKTISMWVNASSTTEKLVSLDNIDITIFIEGGVATSSGITNPTFYVDGVATDNISTGWHLLTVTTDTAFHTDNLYFGRINNVFYQGEIDETRMSSQLRSQAWIETEYNNQNNPELFFAVQDEEVGGGPIGYWSFDEGYGTTAHDESSSENNGIITGATWQDESMCVSGKCLYFDGYDDYVNIGKMGNLGADMNDSPVTLSFWFKTTSSTDSIFIGVVDILSGNVLTIGGDESDSFLINITDAMSDGIVGGVLNLNDYWCNSWHHFETVIDNNETELVIYLDGVRKIVEYGAKSSGSFSNFLYDFYIGAININNNDQMNFEGYLDEVKVYPYARTADQIKQDYNAGMAGVGGEKGIAASFGGATDGWMSDGLVGYWKMDESATTSGAIDTSGNGNDGVYEGNASTTAGKFGWGGVFDGTGDYITWGNNSDFAFERTDTFSIGVWVKSTDNGGTIIGKMDAFDPYKGYDMYMNNGYWNVNIRNDTDDNGIYVRSLLDVGDNIWHHLLFTYDGSSQASGLKMYVDGQDDTGDIIQDNLTESILNNSSFSFGARNIDSSFDGQIDEVRIYNRALSSDEVRKLYEWAPGPVLHLKMDEKEGNNVYDKTGNGNDGTINGAIWARGKNGSALEFDGIDDFVNVDHDLSNGWGAITYEAWVYPRTEKAWMGIIQKGYRQPFAMEINNGNLTVGITLENNENGYYGGGSVDLNKWTHLTTTFNQEDGKILFYKNGILSGTAQMSVGISLDDNPSDLIGIGRGMLADRYFEGVIDDVRIYNYVRTQKQVLEDMNGDRSAIKSTVLDLSFDEGYGGISHDGSGNGHDALFVPEGYATTTMWSHDGVDGNSLAIPNVQRVEIPSLDVFEYNDFAISAWYKSDTLLDPIDDRYIYWHTDGTDIINLSVTEDTGHERTARINVRRDGINNYFYGTSDMVDQNWHHIVAMKKDGRVKIYIDGELEADEDDNLDDGSISIDSINGNVALGSDYDNSNALYGLLDELKMWNYGLNIDEIKTVYNQSKTIVMGKTQSANNSGKIVTGANTDYCIPGDTAQCSSPILELKMDEKSGTTVYDTSGEGNDGTITGATWARGKNGSALSFDGVDDYVSVDDNDLYSPSYNDLSLSFWSKVPVDFDAPGGTGGGNEGAYFIGKLQPGDAEWAVENDNNDTLCFILWQPSGNEHGEIEVPMTINDGLWHYYTATVDYLNEMRLYVDGVLKGTDVSFTNNMGNGNRPIEIGKRFDGNYSKGEIDDVKIYNYVRTPAQIAYDYNRGKPIAHWSFDECQGGTIHDESGNGYNGILNLGTSGIIATGTCASSSDSFWYNGGTGKVNSAGSFDGVDDYVEIYDGRISDTTEGTISAWISFSERGNIVAYGGGDVANPGFFEFDIRQDTNYYFAVTQVSDGGSPSSLRGSIPLSINTWYHVVLISDGIEWSMYVNGEQDTLVSLPADVLGNTGNWFGDTTVAEPDKTSIGNIMYDGSYNGTYFEGLIDDVKIYNYALTLEQVKQDYAGGAVRFQ